MSPTVYRDSEGVNLAFDDGHVEYKKKDKVRNEETTRAPAGPACGPPSPTGPHRRRAKNPAASVSGRRRPALH